MHTPFRSAAEAILVLQSHDDRGEQVLERAPASSPLDRHLGEDKRSGSRRGTITRGGDNKNGGEQQQW